MKKYEISTTATNMVSQNCFSFLHIHHQNSCGGVDSLLDRRDVDDADADVDDDVDEIDDTDDNDDDRRPLLESLRKSEAIF